MFTFIIKIVLNEFEHMQQMQLTDDIFTIEKIIMSGRGLTNPVFFEKNEIFLVLTFHNIQEKIPLLLKKMKF